MIASQADGWLPQLESSERLARFGTTAYVLAEIYRSDTNLTVWRRELAASIVAECEQLLGRKEEIAARLVTPAADVRRSLLEAVPSLVPCTYLTNDICLLTDMFSSLFELQAIGIRLTTLSTAMCPKFHVDRVPCRLITTYVGEGTEWLPYPNASVRKPHRDQNDSYASSNDLRQLSTGDVALLKGESWEGNEGAGVVHRSPAINLEKRRLLLTFDMI